MTVPAVSDGHDTKIILEAGETYELEARGRWKDDWILCRPDGVPVNSDWKQRLNARVIQRIARAGARLALRFWPWRPSGMEPLVKYRLFALVGQIRQENGAFSETFLIGFGPRQFKPPVSGVLVVRANDYPSKYGNNHGSISLEVRKVSVEKTVEIAYEGGPTGP